MEISCHGSFVLPSLESRITKLATGKNSLLLLVYVAEQAGLNFNLVTNPKDIVSAIEAHIMYSTKQDEFMKHYTPRTYTIHNKAIMNYYSYSKVG